MKKLIYFLTLSFVVLLVNSGVVMATKDDVSTPTAPAPAVADAADDGDWDDAWEDSADEALKTALNKELAALARAWEGGSSSKGESFDEREESAVRKEVQAFIRRLQSEDFKANLLNKDTLSTRLQKDAKNQVNVQQTYEQGARETVELLREARTRLEKEDAERRLGTGNSSRSAEAIATDLQQNLVALHEQVVGHLQGASGIYLSAALLLVKSLRTDVNALKVALQKGETVEKEPVLAGSTEDRNALKRRLGNIKTSVFSVQTDLAKSEGRAERKLRGAHNVARDLAALYEDYTDLFADDEEEGDRAAAKGQALARLHIAQGRAAHADLLAKRLEDVTEVLGQLGSFDPAAKDSGSHQVLWRELGDMRAGKGASNRALRRLTDGAKAIQAFTQTGPLVSHRQDMMRRIQFAGILSPYARVLNASLSVLLRNMFPGVFNKPVGRARRPAPQPGKAAAAAPESEVKEEDGDTAETPVSDKKED